MTYINTFITITNIFVVIFVVGTAIAFVLMWMSCIWSSEFLQTPPITQPCPFHLLLMFFFLSFLRKGTHSQTQRTMRCAALNFPRWTEISSQQKRKITWSHNGSTQCNGSVFAFFTLLLSSVLCLVRQLSKPKDNAFLPVSVFAKFIFISLLCHIRICFFFFVFCFLFFVNFPKWMCYLSQSLYLPSISLSVCLSISPFNCVG